jgi:hypothetical protein
VLSFPVDRISFFNTKQALAAGSSLQDVRELVLEKFLGFKSLSRSGFLLFLFLLLIMMMF